MKNRWYPDKPANKKGGKCELYNENPCYCEFGISGKKTTCEGNPHNCIKTYYKRLASRSNTQINNGEYRK